MSTFFLLHLATYLDNFPASKVDTFSHGITIYKRLLREMLRLLV
jgi:hypothetical protein